MYLIIIIELQSIGVYQTILNFNFQIKSNEVKIHLVST